MSSPLPLKKLIGSLAAFEKHLDKLPDDARGRLIGCAVNAAALAIRVDKPSHDLRGLFETQIAMINDCLERWSEEDGLQASCVRDVRSDIGNLVMDYRDHTGNLCRGT